MDLVPKRLLPALLLLGASAPAVAETLSGPVEARVLRVIDGDTFVAEALVWPGQSIRVSVRIRGIDAPEMRSRCAREKDAATRARDMLEHLVGNRPVRLSNIGGGKYYGRVLADVADAEGRGIAPALLGRGMVRAYDGGRRIPYCGD